MKKIKPGRWIVLALIIAVAYALLSGPNGLIGHLSSKREVSTMRKELKSLQSTVDSLTIEIVKLKNDTAYIEKIAREKLGMALPNERVYKFVDKKD